MAVRRLLAVLRVGFGIASNVDFNTGPAFNIGEGLTDPSPEPASRL